MVAAADGRIAAPLNAGQFYLTLLQYFYIVHLLLNQWRPLLYSLFVIHNSITMGGVPVKHHTKSKVGRRRSHLALKPSQIAVCPSCQSPVMPHRMCANCGSYKGSVVKAPRVKVQKEAAK
jgi:large subunit ribosomal protein L32